MQRTGIAPLTAGFAGLDASLSFVPTEVPQDIEGNTIRCETPEGAPGGVFIRIWRGDAAEVDPQARANEFGGERLEITDPVQLLGGTMIVTRPPAGKTWHASWSDANVTISACIGTDPQSAD